MTKNLEFTESINKIYEAMVISQCQVICFTSITKQAGVTSIASEIAKKNIIRQQKTLFCDFGCYDSSLSKKIGMSTDVASGDSFIADVCNSICFVEELGFYLIPQNKDIVATLQNEKTLIDLMNALKSKYELIIIDSYHYYRYASDVISPRILCSIADAVILIVLSGSVTATDIQYVVQDINHHHGQLIGCVMNDRNCPKLVNELCREVDRLKKFSPRLVKIVKHWLLNTPLLKIDD